MIYVVLIIITLYIFLILSLIIGFDNVKSFKPHECTPKTTFSIIIPFRDESENLPILLQSLENLNYPKELFEILFIDDNSKDKSVKILEKFFLNTRNNMQVLNNQRRSDSPKKDAIKTAIEQAKNDWIITTDADCIVFENWLNTFNNFILNNKTEFIVAPVTYKIENNFLEKFQLLDILSLQGATIGGFGIKKPFLCNGANLCYSKKIFTDVNGFDGNTKIASGDDIFLLEKALKDTPTKVHYLKSSEAIVITNPQPTIQKLINQHIRWAAKTTNYSNFFSKFVGIVIFLMNSLLVVLFFVTLVGLFNWKLLLIIFLIKLVIDTLLLAKTTYFFKQQKVLSSIWLNSLIYPFFTMFVALLSFQKKFEWKGRSFKK